MRSMRTNPRSPAGWVLRPLTDEAFRNIALGESFFRFTGLDYTAPQMCKIQRRSVAAATNAAAQ
jgi:hypothetical protein